MLGYLLSPVLQIEDINGLPLVNGKVYVYEANTSNLATIYSNYEGTLNTNPAILDLAGHTTIIADDVMMYDITVKDKDDNLLFSAKDVAVGGEGGSAIVSDVTVRAGGNGISVVQSVENNTKVFTVSIDYSFVASKTDLNSKQNTLTPGDNISISGDTISVTGLKTINVTAPLQKTETTSAINLSIDTSGLQFTLSAGTNIDEVKLSNNIVDLKHDNCSASINSIAIGRETLASGDCSFAEGNETYAIGNNSHSEGHDTSAIGLCSHAEGYQTNASAQYTHAEGMNTVATEYGAHSEGSYTSAVGMNSHAEGHNTIASGQYSHVEGEGTSAIGIASHAEGSATRAVGTYSHVEGDRTQSIGLYSHAEGYQTSAIGDCSHTEGRRTIASGDYQTVIGKYNAPNTTDLFQIGCGSGINARQNVFEVKNDNSIWYNYNNVMTQLTPANDPAPPVYLDSNNFPTYYSFVALDGLNGFPSWLNVPNAQYQNGIVKNSDNNCYSLVDRSSNKMCEVDADFVIKIDALPENESIIDIGYGVEDEKVSSPTCRNVLFYDIGIYYIHLHCLVYGKDFYFFGSNRSYLVGGGTASIYLQNVSIRSI